MTKVLVIFPLVHWRHHERTKLNVYIDRYRYRYGDVDGVA